MPTVHASLQTPKNVGNVEIVENVRVDVTESLPSCSTLHVRTSFMFEICNVLPSNENPRHFSIHINKMSTRKYTFLVPELFNSGGADKGHKLPLFPSPTPIFCF